MPDAAAWLDALTGIAPGIDRTMLRVIAHLLATRARPDTLLTVRDALREAAAELIFDRRYRRAAELVAIGAILENAPSLRCGAFW
jgi:hypothetical protein